MFYLIRETLGRKRCIDRNESDFYTNNQFYDCLNSYPFDESSIILLRTIRIRCIASPAKLSYAEVYTDASETIAER